MTAQVYFNLHKKSWSIRDPKTGRVTNKAQAQYLVVLIDVTFKVNEGGRQRVIRDERKNVHAFACGTLVDPQTVVTRFKEATVPVTYNPYKAGHFVRTDTGRRIKKARFLLLTTKLIEKPGGKLVRIPKVLAAL